MRNIAVALEYDGTDFCGFQRQAGATTVQECVEDALKRLTQEEVRLPGQGVKGAGRTDAGVHAYAQVVNFSTESRIPVAQWPAALNSALPSSIAAWEAREVPAEFHARKCVRWKTYLYRILHRVAPSPLERRYAYQWARPLEVAAMQAAGQVLQGKHDFSAFARREAGDRRSPVRTVRRVACWEEGEIVNVVVEANGFLYRMVRSIVGTLLAIGSGAMKQEAIEELLASGERAAAGPTAPPQGLFLAAVEYDCVHLRARFGRQW